MSKSLNENKLKMKICSKKCTFTSAQLCKYSKNLHFVMKQSNIKVRVLLLSIFDFFLSIGRDIQLHTSLHDKRDDFNFHITNFPFRVATSHLCQPMAFLSHNSSDTQGLAHLMNVLF